MNDAVTFVFFMVSIGIFLLKIANVITYKFVPGERSLKYYGKDVSLMTFIVVLFAYLFMMVSFMTTSGEIPFLEQYGLPVTSYLEQGIYLAISNLILVLTGVLTFAEMILLGWADIRSQMERQRRGFYNKKNEPRLSTWKYKEMR